MSKDLRARQAAALGLQGCAQPALRIRPGPGRASSMRRRLERFPVRPREAPHHGSTPALAVADGTMKALPCQAEGGKYRKDRTSVLALDPPLAGGQRAIGAAV